MNLCEDFFKENFEVYWDDDSCDWYQIDEDNGKKIDHFGFHHDEDKWFEVNGESFHESVKARKNVLASKFAWSIA